MTIVWGTIQISILGVIVYLIQYYFNEKMKSQLTKKNNEYLEQLRWDLKAKEQAEKVAEYISIARNLNESRPNEDFVKANKLAWELAMWLPADLYKAMGQALVNPTDDNNELTIITKVRKLLLTNDIEGLTSKDILVHGPNIGKKDI
ncbi:hypothetical protein R0K17_05690 [Planococcus sp. SIMBA_143]